MNPDFKRGQHLIVTVGGATDVPLFLIKTLKPQSVHFLYSAQTKSKFEEAIKPALQVDHQTHEINANDPVDVHNTVHAVLTELFKTNPIAVYCDATSGNTAMGIGVTLAARRFEARMTYVEYRKENTGTEQPTMVLHHLELPVP